jgi:tetratricopeptide (TPR) repeat protein
MKIGDMSGGDLIERLQAGAQAHRRPQKTRKCPDEDRLRLLLPGQLEPEEADKLLTHAAECDWCGTVLREAAQDLTDPPTGEEEELAGKARLADPRQRREFVESIVTRREPTADGWRLPILRWWPAWGLAAAALVGGVSYQQWMLSAAHTEGLLARAYTKRRPMEMRVPEAEWGQLRIQMGVGSSSSHEPPELPDARSNITRGIDAHPDDPKWLKVEGEADLLEGREGVAIDELERARSLRPGDVTILVDLGVAYYQRGAKADDPGSYSLAYERLSEGVRLKPKDPTLLFDQALAAEHIETPGVAQTAWEAYLKVDSSSGFAREAEAHLENVKKNSSNSGTTPPTQFLTH